MKKILILLAAARLIVALAGCDGADPNTEPSDGGTNGAEQTTAIPAATTRYPEEIVLPRI